MLGEQMIDSCNSNTGLEISPKKQVTSALGQIYVSSTVQPAITACVAALLCASQSINASCICVQARLTAASDKPCCTAWCRALANADIVLFQKYSCSAARHTEIISYRHSSCICQQGSQCDKVEASMPRSDPEKLVVLQRQLRHATSVHNARYIAHV
jgi:hypothetical protein